MTGKGIKLFLGISACKNGWVACVLPTTDEPASYITHTKLRSLLGVFPGLQLACIDIPTVLEEGPGPRGCDDRARKILGLRGKTDGYAPSKSVLKCKSYKDAVRCNKRDTGIMLSKESWALIPKMKEIAELMNGGPRWASKLLESNPDLVILGLTGDLPQSSDKTTKGLTERRDILREFGIDISTKDIGKYSKKGKVQFTSKNIYGATFLALGAQLLFEARKGSKAVAPKKGQKVPGRIHFPIVAG